MLAATQRRDRRGGRGGVPLLTAELASADEARFRLALQAARELGVAAGGALAARVEKDPPMRRMLLIVALGDIGDRAALPAILAPRGKVRKRHASRQSRCWVVGTRRRPCPCCWMR